MGRVSMSHFFKIHENTSNYTIYKNGTGEFCSVLAYEPIDHDYMDSLFEALSKDVIGNFYALGLAKLELMTYEYDIKYKMFDKALLVIVGDRDE